MAERLEQKVSQTILQKPVELTIGGEIYQVSPPSTATLILASELICELPVVKLDENDILIETLYIAKDCKVLGDILAVLILGAKNLKTTKEITQKSFWRLIEKKTVVEIDSQKELAEKLLLNLSPRELNNLLAELLKKMHIADFFGLTTSLLEINLLRRTREVEMTASGQQLQE